MADPKIKNGHIDIANTIADKLCSYRLNGQEWQIIWVILRKTWGWLTNPEDKNSLKKKMDKIALSQFAKLTGINRSRCHAILKRLLNKRIIKKTVTQKCNTSLISYGIQSDFDLWKVLPKSATVTQKCNRVLPKSATKVLPKSATTKDTSTKDTSTKDILAHFDQFYEAYPRKKSKGQARKTWEKLVKRNKLPELSVIIKAIDLQKNGQGWQKDNGEYIPYPSTWLNAEGWEDEVEIKEKQGIKDEKYNF